MPGLKLCRDGSLPHSDGNDDYKTVEMATRENGFHSEYIVAQLN